MKKALSILLTLALMINVFTANIISITANADEIGEEGHYIYYVSNEEAEIIYVDGDISGNVVIPEKLGGYPVTSIGTDAFQFCYNLKSVVIPSTVTHIGGYAFHECTSLTSITIPDGVTYIGIWAFYDCTSLKSITLPDSITLIEKEAFYNTAYYNNSNNWKNDVLYIGRHAIKSKESLSGDYAIKEGTLTIAGNAFEFCSGLTSITIPDGVVSIGDSAFWFCTRLTSVTIPDSVVFLEGHAFYKCTNLKSVTLSNQTVYIGEYAFYQCTGLTSITIPDSVVLINNYAFQKCTNLTSITIPDSVAWIGKEAFKDCGYYANNENWDNGVLYIDNHLISTKTTYSGAYSIKEKTLTIASDAFKSCSKLTSITIPDGVISIGNGAFMSCTGLTSVTIPDSVAILDEYAFYQCTKLNSVTLSNQVSYIGAWAFYGCSSLTSITIPDSVIFIDVLAFSKCTSLTYVILPNDLSWIEKRAFEGCSNLTDVWFTGSESDLEEIEIVADGNEELGNAAWHYNTCTSQHAYSDFFDDSCDCCDWNRGEIIVTSSTLLEIQQNILGIKSLTIEFFDTNSDGKLDATDLSIIQTKIVGF